MEGLQRLARKGTGTYPKTFPFQPVETAGRHGTVVGLVTDNLHPFNADPNTVSQGYGNECVITHETFKLSSQPSVVRWLALYVDITEGIILTQECAHWRRRDQRSCLVQEDSVAQCQIPEHLAGVRDGEGGRHGWLAPQFWVQYLPKSYPEGITAMRGNWNGEKHENAHIIPGNRL
jgi:hypothetical protein